MNIFDYWKCRISLSYYIKRHKNNIDFSKKRISNEILIKNDNQKKKILVCMHSFEWGGAERFAYETILFLKKIDSDFLIFVEKKTEIASYFLPVIDGIPITYAEDYQKSENQIIDLIQKESPNIVSIHHSWSAYRGLSYFPRDVFVIDSLHIVEYQTGGYPYLSAKNSRYINIHHAVSVGLKKYLMDELGVFGYKVEVATLLRDMPVVQKKKWDDNRVVVGFLGRLEKQKRPELFIELARIFKKNKSFVFVMQGDGALLENICQLSDNYHLDNLTILPSSDNIGGFYQRIDILVNCSENEGLALVGIESAQYQTICISTNVGQQNEIISDLCLLNPSPIEFLYQTQELIQKICVDDKFREDILFEQAEKLGVLTQNSFEAVLKKYLS